MKRTNNMAKRAKLPELETFDDKMKSVLTFWALFIMLMPFAGVSAGIAVRAFLWIV